jgi:hypothetical protein
MSFISYSNYANDNRKRDEELQNLVAKCWHFSIISVKICKTITEVTFFVFYSSFEY